MEVNVFTIAAGIFIAYQLIKTREYNKAYKEKRKEELKQKYGCYKEDARRQ